MFLRKIGRFLRFFLGIQGFSKKKIWPENLAKEWLLVFLNYLKILEKTRWDGVEEGDFVSVPFWRSLLFGLQVCF